LTLAASVIDAYRASRSLSRALLEHV